MKGADFICVVKSRVTIKKCIKICLCLQDSVLRVWLQESQSQASVYL